MKLLIYSGGMDSTVLLHRESPAIQMALSFNYGSQHNNREIGYAMLNCHDLGIEHISIDIQHIGNLLSSNLLRGEIPEGHYEDESMKKTVVPFRNGIMLSIATGVAESNNLDSVLIANHFGDHAIYPDCRATFIESMRETMAYGTYENIILESPFVNMTKREVAFLGRDLDVDFTKTYSCYKGKEKHCGKCGTCTERKEALAGFDETEYAL